MDASLVGGVAVLERAIAYALGNLAYVTPESLGRPTPCDQWNLYDLLEHFHDSLAALHEAAEDGRVGGIPYYLSDSAPGSSQSGSPPRGSMPPGSSPAGPCPDGRSWRPGPPPAGRSRRPGDPMLTGFHPARSGRASAADVVPRVRDRAVRLLGSWASADGSAAVCVGEMLVTAPLIAGAGAIEVTVHGWDVGQATGHPRPIPPELAEELLDLAVLFVRSTDRPGRFARPIPVPATAPAGDRLLGFLGREP